MAKTKFLRGDEARSLLEKQISEHNNGLLSALANYQASNAVRVWHDTIRAIEEFVNVLVDLDDEALIGWLASIPLDDRFLRDPGSVCAVGRALEPHFERGTIERFCRLMIQIAAIGSGFRQHGQVDFGAGISLRTVRGCSDLPAIATQAFRVAVVPHAGSMQGTIKASALGHAQRAPSPSRA